MDNGLRQSTMSMENIGKNLTIGEVSDFYDAYFRNWNLENVMVMPVMTSTSIITNKMIPDVNIYYAALHRELNLGKFNVSGKAGISHQNVGEVGRIEFYKNLHPDAEGSR